MQCDQRTTTTTAKKGLLERRNSNASLTLQLESTRSTSNIQKRALSTSNCYLRDSNLSLSSGNLEESRICTMCGGGGILRKNVKRTTNATSTKSNLVNDGFDEKSDPIESTDDMETATSHDYEPVTVSYSDRSGRRKFLSSENLNASMTFTLHEPPIKTTSFVDLNQSPDEMDVTYDDLEDTCCTCTTNSIRSITTKPLSPQTTSEDFKIYLANIQMLQNASNILTGHKLHALGVAFKRNFTAADEATDVCTACDGCIVCKTCKLCQTKCRCEQNCLLTSLHQEFWDLPTNYQEKPLVFGSQAKNRYKTILPNEHSRVLLAPEIDSMAPTTHMAKEQSAIDLYINANYIKVSRT